MDTPPVVSDYSYARWALHYSVISVMWRDMEFSQIVWKKKEKSFGDFLDEQLLPAINPFNGENPRSVLVMGEHCIIWRAKYWIRPFLRRLDLRFYLTSFVNCGVKFSRQPRFIYIEHTFYYAKRNIMSRMLWSVFITLERLCVFCHLTALT